MFRWLPLVWANLKRRKLRLVFTFISILLAFLMFGMLDALRTSSRRRVNIAGADRLLMQSKINMTVPLPRSHYEKVRATPGVNAAAPFNWFGGIYKDAKQPIQMQADGSRSNSSRCIRRSYSSPKRSTAWKHDRQGIIIGQAARRPIRLEGRQTAFRCARRSGARLDGSDTWEFNIVGIYDVERRRREQGQRLLPVRLLQRVAAVRQGQGRA